MRQFNKYINAQCYYIDSDAFSHSGLTSVTFPSSVTSIGNDAFTNCSSLDSITVLSNTVSLDDGFYYCNSLTKIYCYEGSAAQAYANTRGIECIILHLESNYTSPQSHEHNWSWQTINEPTEYCDGMEGYICTVCGATKNTVTIPSVGVFMVNRYNEVMNATDGETVVLDMGLWHSLSKGFMEEIAKKRNTTFVIRFIYKGKKYEVVIPAGQPLVLDLTIDWYGPLKQNQMFGMKEVF